MKTPEEMAEEYSNSQNCLDDQTSRRHAFLAGYQAVAPQWISVKDRLPEIGVDVLISYGGLPFYHLAFLTHNGDIKWFNGNHSNTEYSLDDVTHWMPLPEPPKDAKE